MDNFEQLSKELRWVMAFALIFAFISILIVFLQRNGNLTNSIHSCDEFKEIYETCIRLNLERCQTNDRSKIESTASELKQMVDYYNIKCDNLGRSWCKSNGVTYKLSAEQFSCNN